MEFIELKVEGGLLRVVVVDDPEYPGVDIGFIPDNEDENDDEKIITYPRILLEKPKGEKLRALIWDDKDSEDYSKKIEFED